MSLNNFFKGSPERAIIKNKRKLFKKYQKELRKLTPSDTEQIIKLTNEYKKSLKEMDKEKIIFFNNLIYLDY